MSRITAVVAVPFSVVLVGGVLVGCSSSSTSSDSSGTNVATVQLEDMPTGTATLNFDPTAKQLAVTYSMYGLAPTSFHPNAIQAGTCEKPGKVLYTMDALAANAAGVADTTNTIENVTESQIPQDGWILNILNGPGTDTEPEATSIACAAVTGPDSPMTLNLDKAGGADPGPSGSAQLNIENGQLVTSITLSGLVPNTEHAAHIHSGACNNQGDVLYPYPAIKADSSGNGTVTMTVPDVSSIPTTGWYVNVHRSTHLDHQTGFDPIACGNVA